MYHVATPPAEQPEIYEMRSDGEGDGCDEWYVRMVADTTTLWFRMDAGDDDQPGEVCWSGDPLMDWYHGLPRIGTMDFPALWIGAKVPMRRTRSSTFELSQLVNWLFWTLELTSASCPTT